MNVKRWFRGPWLWVVLFAIVILVVVDMVSKSDGSEQIDTSTMISDIQEGKVKDVTLVEGDQRIEATLDDGSDQKVTSNYVAPQGDSVVKALEQAKEAGELDNYNSEVPKPSLLWSFLGTVFPILLIVLFFLLGGLFLFSNFSSYLVQNRLGSLTDRSGLIASAIAREIESAGGRGAAVGVHRLVNAA